MTPRLTPFLCLLAVCAFAAAPLPPLPPGLPTTALVTPSTNAPVVQVHYAAISTTKPAAAVQAAALASVVPPAPPMWNLQLQPCTFYLAVGYCTNLANQNWQALTNVLLTWPTNILVPALPPAGFYRIGIANGRQILYNFICVTNLN